MRLIAVSKTQPAEAVREAYAAGQRDFGENYVQELVEKAEALRDLTDLRWHMIGHLQRNKAKQVAPLVGLVHTVDSIDLARELAKRVAAAAPDRRLQVLVEVSIAGEAQKHGVAPGDLAELCGGIEALPALSLGGLMCVPPATADAADARPFFDELSALRERHGGAARLPELSMGMTHDLEHAVAAGATLVRSGHGNLRSAPHQGVRARDRRARLDLRPMAKRPTPQSSPTLLEAAARRSQLGNQAMPPLADRMRPQSLEEVVGQKQILREGRLLHEVIQKDRVPSLILWGPPGSGKTTLANVISQLTRAEFVRFSAVLGGLPELREILAAARERRAYQGKSTLLFVDEIHRFNKGQQDAFLPHVEDGSITLIGATTENPSFAINAAVLSRCRVFRLEALEAADLEELLRRALADSERGLGKLQLQAEPQAIAAIAHAARGDARRALGMLETAAGLLPPAGKLDLAVVEAAAETRTLLYDKAGEEHYNVVSALIKSMRGSDPDAALYWLMRMLEAGDDPLFLLRRLMIFASEDVGNADPRALSVAVDADAAFRRMGMPEGNLSVGSRLLVLG